MGEKHKNSVDQIVNSLIQGLAEFHEVEISRRTRGYRLVCQAPNHPGPRTHLGTCRETQREARQDMLDHAEAHHDGSTSGMTYLGRCDLEDDREDTSVVAFAEDRLSTSKTKLVEANFEELYHVDASSLDVRPLSSSEQDFLTNRQQKLQFVQRQYNEVRPLGDVLYGACFNNSVETIGVYGPKLPGETHDNSLYLLPSERRTPRFWDCDGFFVPNDRRYPIGVGRYQSGPIAIKVRDLDAVHVRTTRPRTYSASSDTFALTLLRPGDVNWNMPNISHRRMTETVPSIG